MCNYPSMLGQLKSSEVIGQLNNLYGRRDGMLVMQTLRYSNLLKKHEELVHHDGQVYMISAPGRTEIGGNHTDHNRGKVLAAAINLDTLAAVTPRDDGCVNIFSEGYKPVHISLDDLENHDEEKGTTTALIRGIAFKMQEEGYKIGGFDAVMTSSVASGSGLSSSAAVEVLFCAIFDILYNDGNMDFKKRAQYSQYAENVYFRKPCGLMDQMASSAGGLVYIDFQNDVPEVNALNYDFSKKGYSLVVVNSGGSHFDLTPEYAAIPEEMRAVAAYFGKEQLRTVLPERFKQSIPLLRKELKCANPDRAIMRASHFFAENRRVSEELYALQDDDLQAFFRLVIESGRSSFCYLQNIFPAANREELALALLLSEEELAEDGAWRVHGGGFAGTTLNFVPQKHLPAFIAKMESIFGEHSCSVLDIRPVGPACVRLG